MEPIEHSESDPSRDNLALVLRFVLGAVLAAVAAVGIGAWYAYSVTPEAIRHPAQTHVHLRLQVIVGGKPVNFADSKFQTPENKDICTAALTKEPVHFHDNLDQFVHLHWAHISGGILLKDYGWNLIGGPSGTLGYRFDKLPSLMRVPIHGAVLPKPPDGSRLYVFTGNENDFQERSSDDFLHNDLADFFAGRQTSRGLVPAAYATDEQQLAELNHVLGNVVIFAQKDRPTDAQVRDRFNHLIPLPQSACAG